MAVMPVQNAKMNAKRKVLVTRDLDELTGGMTSLSMLCSVVGKGLLATGIFLMARKLWKHYRRWEVCPSVFLERHRHSAEMRCLLCRFKYLEVARLAAFALVDQYTCTVVT